MEHPRVGKGPVTSSDGWSGLTFDPSLWVFQIVDPDNLWVFPTLHCKQSGPMVSASVSPFLLWQQEAEAFPKNPGDSFLWTLDAVSSWSGSP